MKTKTQSSVTQGDKSGYPSGQWLYDELMQWIEPDLCSGSIAHLDELYPNESAEDRAARYERYTIAFMAFEDALLNYQERVEDDVMMWSLEAEQYVRAKHAREEGEKMQEIEKAIDDSAPAA